MFVKAQESNEGAHGARPTNRHDYISVIRQINYFTYPRMRWRMTWNDKEGKWKTGESWCDEIGEPQNSRHCRLPLWTRCNIVASHLVGPSSILGRINFPGWDFFSFFSSTVRQMSGKLRLHPSPDFIGHHNHKKSITKDAYDLWGCRALKHIQYILIPTLPTQLSPGDTETRTRDLR